METDINKPKGKRSGKKKLLWILGGIFLFLSIVSFIIYIRFNSLLTAALLKNFNSTSISEVYELKFERLSVNLILGNIKVYDVQFHPREVPLRNYPYINTSLKLKTNKILLTNVEIFTLLKSNILKLDRVEIAEPSVSLFITDDIPILFPFRDTTHVDTTVAKDPRSPVGSFLLKEFELIDASFEVVNLAKEREFSIKKFSISLQELLISQLTGYDVISYKHIDISIEGAKGKLQKESVRHASFSEFRIAIDSLEVRKSIDTIVYDFADLRTVMKDLDLQTADSVFHIAMKSFDLHYMDKSIKLEQVLFKPNITETAMQARYKYQNTQFSGSVGSLQLLGVNFDSLIYQKKLLIDEIVLDSVFASIFKDKSKPMDTGKFPEYLGQTVMAIPMPLLVKQVKATNVNLVNRERNPDGTYGKANVNRATLKVEHVSNLSPGEPMVIHAEAYLENKVHFKATLGFSYQKPEFSFNGRLGKFSLPDLNPIIQAYSPAAINGGIVDEITFSGMAYKTYSEGTLKFLYHDLNIALELREEAKWRNSVLAFAANTAVATANPAEGQPAREVKFHADRDMNKAFVNLVIKSILDGFKETIVMSKENRKIQNEKKKEMKQDEKKEKKK
jgi:hypothetical protein